MWPNSAIVVWNDSVNWITSQNENDIHMYVLDWFYIGRNVVAS